MKIYSLAGDWWNICQIINILTWLFKVPYSMMLWIQGATSINVQFIGCLLSAVFWWYCLKTSRLISGLSIANCNTSLETKMIFVHFLDFSWENKYFFPRAAHQLYTIFPEDFTYNTTKQIVNSYYEQNLHRLKF